MVAWASSRLTEPAPRAIRPAGPGPSRTGLQGCSVLLVEDNPFNQIVTRELLELQGVLVTVVSGGYEALSRLAGDEAFDLVLMDVHMPDLDGLETTRRLRAGGWRPGLPVIAMTAQTLEEDRSACRAAGMDDFVTKPFEPPHLYERLSSWLAPATLPPALPRRAP